MKHVKELKSVGVDLHIPGPSCLGVRASMAAIREIRAFMMADEEAAIDTPYGPVVGSKETIEALQLVLMQPAQPKPKPIPFNLEAAKAGAPLVTRDGRKARFLAHVPEAHEDCRVVAFIEGSTGPTEHDEDGSYCGQKSSKADLFLAPKPKRTVWMNIYNNRLAALFDSEKDAREYYNSAHALAVAVPVEIEA